MCRMWRFLAIHRSLFHSSLLYTLFLPPTSLSSLPHFILPSVPLVYLLALLFPNSYIILFWGGILFSPIYCTCPNQRNLFFFFMCCWPCIFVIFDFMFQLSAPFLYYVYHIPLHVSSNILLIIRRIHCMRTASGSLCVTLLRWPLSAQAHNNKQSSNCLCTKRSPKRVTYKEPDAVCIQWILLMMSKKLLETCRGMW